MKIMFGILVCRFKDHGVSIVFANMTKIIVNTKKYSL